MRVWQSIHTHYVQFAYESLQKCASPIGHDFVHLDRPTIETIRYSYDALEAVADFVFHMARTRQIRFEPKSLVDFDQMAHQWRDVKLSKKLKHLGELWTGRSFWHNENEFQLFADLKKVRDGLTHPEPYGVEESQRSAHTDSLLKPEWLVYPGKAVARFEPLPELLGKDDAEQAFEILLHHLLRIQNDIWGSEDTFFCINHPETAELLSTSELLEQMTLRFATVWQQPAN